MTKSNGAGDPAHARRIAEAAIAINAATSVDAMLAEITERARDVIGAHQAITSLTVGEDWSQAISAVSLSDRYAAWRDYAEPPSGAGIYRQVCERNRPMRMTQAELEAHPAWRGFGEAAERHPPMRGWLAAPLVGAGGANLGLVQLSDRDEGEFTEADEAVLVLIAQMGAVALERLRGLRVLEGLVEEQRSLGILQHQIALGASVERVCDLAPVIARRVTGARFAAVVPAEGGGVATRAAPAEAAGELAGLEGVMAAARGSGRPEREALAVPTPGQSGHRAAVAVPILVGNRMWGVVVAARPAAEPFTDRTGMRLHRIALLLGMAFENAEARARLEAQASTDAVTGVLGHRAVNQRLAREAERAEREGAPLAVAVLDVDGFGAVEGVHGFEAGERVLAEIAARAVMAVGSRGAVGRLGGDQFCLVLPDHTAEEALAAVERVRDAIAAQPVAPAGTMTASAGLADSRWGTRPEELLRLAHGALYWVRAQGADSGALAYDPGVVTDLSADERERRLERRRALGGIRALARAVDAKDHDTHEHSERVARLAVLLAGELGWDPGRIALLEEAALMHDVGKIGVPDAVLFKPGRLTPEEFALVMPHAALGAEIADEVLSDEQVRWIRGHHERWDGTGYPDGLAREAIPDGARILVLADSWDVMTSVRSYKATLPLEDAIAEVRRCAGTHFAPEVADALGRLHAAGDLIDRYAPAPAPTRAAPAREPASMGAGVLVCHPDGAVRARVRRVLGGMPGGAREAVDGDACLQEMWREPPATVVLGGPAKWELLGRIRAVSSVPVMVLSPARDDGDRARAFRAGASDHLAIPFADEELRARSDVLLRVARAVQPAAGSYRDGLLEVDFARRVVRAGGREVPATPIEYRLLATLVERAGTAVPRSELVERVWGPQRPGAPPLEVRQHLSALRRKFEGVAGRELPVVSRRGFGYEYRPPAEV